MKPIDKRLLALERALGLAKPSERAEPAGMSLTRLNDLIARYTIEVRELQRVVDGTVAGEMVDLLLRLERDAKPGEERERFDARRIRRHTILARIVVLRALTISPEELDTLLHQVSPTTEAALAAIDDMAKARDGTVH